MSPSRAPAPPPLKFGPLRAVTSPVLGAPRSADSVASPGFAGDGYCFASPTSTTSTAAAPLLWERKVTSGSASSSNSDGSGAGDAPATKRVKSPRKVNAHSYCGRHSDEYLFGGKGLGDLWRAVTKK